MINLSKIKVFLDIIYVCVDYCVYLLCIYKYTFIYIYIFYIYIYICYVCYMLNISYVYVLNMFIYNINYMNIHFYIT